jgi:hypothetical protein
MKIVENRITSYSWNDFPFRLNNLLVKKSASYYTKSGQVEFDGFNEATVVSEIGKILENSGLEIFYECEAESDKKDQIKCDLFAEPWCESNSIFIEVKLCWIGKDARLYKDEFDRKIMEDILRLKGINTENSDRIFVLVAHSPEEELEYRNESKSLSLKEVIKEIENQIGSEDSYCWSVTDLSQFTVLKHDRLKYLHSFSWFF